MKPKHGREICGAIIHVGFEGATTCANPKKGCVMHDKEARPCPYPNLPNHCSGCTDRRSEGTHQGCTIEHGHIGCDRDVSTSVRKSAPQFNLDEFLAGAEKAGEFLEQKEVASQPARKSAPADCCKFGCATINNSPCSHEHHSSQPAAPKVYCNGADPSCAGNEKCAGHNVTRGTWASLSKAAAPRPWESEFSDLINLEVNECAGSVDGEHPAKWEMFCRADIIIAFVKEIEKQAYERGKTENLLGSRNRLLHELGRKEERERIVQKVKEVYNIDISNI